MNEANLLAQFESQEDWNHARRGVFWQRIRCAIQRCPVDLIPFEEVRTRLHLAQKVCRGIQNIELAHIRGSVGRNTDFTSTFLPRRSHLRQRWQRVKSLSETRHLPPIEVYQVGETYFVADGNHRVSVAVYKGENLIEAYVCEFMLPAGFCIDSHTHPCKSYS